jgi:cytochrome c
LSGISLYSEEEEAMKRKLIYVTVMVVLLGLTGGVSCAEKEKRGTAAEAQALVKKAIAYMKSNGKDAAFTEINNPKGRFIDRDLYIFVYDMKGKCLAHGLNPKMIGKDLIEMRDADGKYFVKERVEIAKTKGSGWQDYKFTDPLTKKIERKRAYVERYEDWIVGCGIYF